MQSRKKIDSSQSDVTHAYWSEPVESLLAALASSAEGLTQAEADQRRQQYGPNTLEIRRSQPPLVLFLQQFKSPIILILLFATAVSAVLQDWADATVILVIVLGSAILSFVQEFNAGRAIEELQAQLQIKTTVLRDGQPATVGVAGVVPGDIVVLSAGSLIPADGVVLETRDCFVNQAVLTGETFPVEKAPGTVSPAANLAARTNAVYMGTNVRSGSARILVVATGNATVYGQIAKRLTLRPPETEFERGVRRLGYLLSEIMLLLVIGIFAFNVYFQKPVIDSLLFSLALAVGLTPQLLPAVININLSKGAQAMARSGVIVRRLAAIENFGSMDILCTDKTGTLTEGVVQLDGALGMDGEPANAVLRAAFVNAHFQTGLTNPLDAAIIAHGTPDISTCRKVDEIPYDFHRKRLSVVVEDSGQSTLITKGALLSVLDVCTHAWIDDHAVLLDAPVRGEIDRRYHDWSEQGFRVLGVARGDVPVKTTYQTSDESALTFMGFLLFLDPPKPDVRETVVDLEQLGIELKIITGDNQLVAQHTAKQIGLPVTGVLTGAQLDMLRTEALWQTVRHTTLFCEVDPNQKERIIDALQKNGHVVGYMGDGVNDAPSLHAADVGISVDQAVDVAKEAADFVLLHKDLAVLHKGIVEGRKTSANTLKYVFMATSANFGNMFSMAGASLLLPFLPMLPKQILLINLLTDLPEMTIAADTVDDTWVQQPTRWDIGFIRRFMFVFGPLSSVFDFLTFAMLLWLFHENPTLFHTGWFVESILSATAVVFALRTRLPFWRSHPSTMLLLTTVLVAAAAVALPYTPLASVLGFSPLPGVVLAIIAAIVMIYFAAAEIVKWWFYRHGATAGRAPITRHVPV